MKKSNLLLMLMVAATLSIAFYRYQSLGREDLITSQFFSALYSERIQNNINKAVLQSDILEDYILLNDGNIPYDNIPSILQLVYDEDIHIGISYAPNGIVEYTHPIEKNSVFIGYNILEDPLSKKDAETALQTEEITFSGPYILSSGQTGLVARNPIYTEKDGEKTFWGFIVILIDPKGGFLKNIGILNIQELGYEFIIESIYNGTNVELVHSDNYKSSSRATENTFDIGLSEWKITLYNSRANHQILSNVILYTAVLFLVSILLYLVVRNLEKEKKNIYEQSLRDSLTKLYNKKGLTYYSTHNQTWLKEGFSLFFIDLNKFKPVNDTYGHEVGDKLLVAFANRLIGHLKKDTFIARVGGDEFVIVLSKSSKNIDNEHIVERIIEVSETPFYIDDHDLLISSSIGFATYPEDGNFEEVMVKADKAMFDYKVKHKKGR